MRTFKLDKFPYDEKIQVYKKNEVTIKPGVTVLVGCNGTGKSTLFKTIKSELDKNEIPVLSYDNISDGGQEMQKSLFYGHIRKLARLATYSEGERIVDNLNDYAMKVPEFIKSQGLSAKPKLELAIFGDKIEEKRGGKSPTEYWFLMDAIGSGLSVDNIEMIRKHFESLCKAFPKHLEAYVIIASNEYEFCPGQQCLNVQECKYVDIPSYEAFRKEVFKTRNFKTKQYAKKEGDNDE